MTPKSPASRWLLCVNAANGDDGNDDGDDNDGDDIGTDGDGRESFG